jgi:hypothetical protein
VAVVPDDSVAESAIVVLVPDTLAPAAVEGFLRDDDFVVLILVGLSVDDPAAGGLLAFEAARRVHVSPPSVMPRVDETTKIETQTEGESLDGFTQADSLTLGRTFLQNG